MTNDKMAKQIARGLTVSDEYPYDYLSAYAGALQAMKWKENQIIEWLWNNFNIHIRDNSVIQGAFNKHFESFDDFIEFMKKDLEKGE